MSFLLAIPGRIKALLFAVAAGAVAALGIYTAGRREGRSRANSEALRKDTERANEIENKADRARGRDGNAIERLRRLNALRGRD